VKKYVENRLFRILSDKKVFTIFANTRNIFIFAPNENIMKIEFEKEYLRELYEKGKTTSKKYRFQPQIINGYVKCVRTLINAEDIEELFTYNALNYEKLKGDKKGLSSVRINDKYRLEFREIIDSHNIPEIKICSLTDITNHYK
jgi:proteic killer suppression protein